MIFRHSTIVVASLALSAASASAQRRWHGSGEAAASLITGNIDQRALMSKAEVSHVDSAFELRASLSFVYSDASHDSLPRRMERRTWLGAIAFDYRSHATVSPFAFVNYESSFEKRVLDRVGVGIGGKLTFIHSVATTASVSLAVLEERLRPTYLSPDTNTITTQRWSGRFRLRHKFDSHVSVANTTFYQPQLTRANIFTVTSTSELNYAVRQSTSVNVSYLSLFDSQAQSRGARKNNDGQLLFGVKVAF